MAQTTWRKLSQMLWMSFKKIKKERINADILRIIVKRQTETTVLPLLSCIERKYYHGYRICKQAHRMYSKEL